MQSNSTGGQCFLCCKGHLTGPEADMESVFIRSAHISSSGMHGFQQQTVQLPQTRQSQQSPSQYALVPSLQPADQIHLGDIVQQGLGHTPQPQYDVQYVPPGQQFYASSPQQQPYLQVPSGQFSGESQGVFRRFGK